MEVRKLEYFGMALIQNGNQLLLGERKEDLKKV